MAYRTKDMEMKDLIAKIGMLEITNGHLNELRELDILELRELEGRLMEGRASDMRHINKEIQLGFEISGFKDTVNLLRDALSDKSDIDPQITPEDMKIMEKDINSGGAARNGMNVKDGMLEISTGVYGEMDVYMKFALISAKIIHVGG